MKQNVKTHKGKKDSYGNPEGTTYAENGVASHEGFDEGLINRTQVEGSAPILYNEDGSVFTVPADADAKLGTFRADILSLKMAIDKGEQKIATCTSMIEEADEADKPIFAKSIASQQAAIDSNKAKKAELEGQMEAFRISLITPSQRADEKELSSLLAQRDKIILRIKELEAKKIVNGVEKTAPKANVSTGNPDQTPEQKAYHAMMVEKHGSQGKAIVALVKEGKTNSEIYKALGIPAASVPGPKNAFRNSADGQLYNWDEQTGTVTGLKA